MNKLVLFLIGLSPMVISIILQLILNIHRPSMALIGTGFILFWIFIGYLTYDAEQHALVPMAIVHLPAFLFLLIIFFQDTFTNDIFLIGFGIPFQSFFLPLGYYTALIMIFSSFLPFVSFNMFTLSLIPFMLMLVAYYLGYFIRKNSKTHK